MYKFAIADINADVAECTPHRVEEHQIAGFEFGLFNFLGGCSLLFRTPWQQKPRGLLINGANKSTAIKTGFRTVATSAIRDSQKSQCANDQLRCFCFNTASDFTDFFHQPPVVEKAAHLVVGWLLRSGVNADADGKSADEIDETHPERIGIQDAAVKQEMKLRISCNLLIYIKICLILMVLRM